MAMKYEPQDDDEEITTLRVPRRVRRKLGMLTNGNESLDAGLERLLDKELESA